MAADDITDDFDDDDELDIEDIAEDDLADDFDDDEDEVVVDDDDDDVADEVDDDFDDDEEDEGDDEDDEEDRDEALEELEAAELEIEDDPETLLVDEAAEIREMRREELGIGGSAREQSADEFVCSECFLVKKTSQLANKKRRVCRDCV